MHYLFSSLQVEVVHKEERLKLEDQRHKLDAENPQCRSIEKCRQILTLKCKLNEILSATISEAYYIHPKWGQRKQEGYASIPGWVQTLNFKSNWLWLPGSWDDCTCGEITDTIKSLKNGKTPGLHGFSNKFYKKKFCDPQDPYLNIMFGQAFDSGELPHTLNEATIPIVTFERNL